MKYFNQTVYSPSLQLHLKLKLCVGAQVILIQNVNVEEGLVNGSRGTVVGFQRHRDAVMDMEMDLPIVRFNSTGVHSGGNEFVVGYSVFERRLDNDSISLQRRQIPLKLGWALTVHKSQGMSLDRVEIDLPRSFSPGQAYVAFSRAKHLEGLVVRNFARNVVYTTQKVKQFYSDLSLAGSPAGLNTEIKTAAVG